MNDLMNSGMSQDDAWNATSIKLAKASEVILQFFIIILNKKKYLFKINKNCYLIIIQ